MLPALLALAPDEPTEMTQPLAHSALLLLLLQVALLLFVARLLGEALRRRKQPAVVGELAAGVLLGPSVFGALAPSLHEALFPASQTQADLLSVISWFGVLSLLVATGMETDPQLIVRRGKTAILVSLGGILVPIALGVSLAFALPDRFVVAGQERLPFALFLGVSLSISAVPVVARVLMDLKWLRRDLGQLTLAAAMTDDTIGWILLSMVAGMATTGHLGLGSAALSVGAALLVLTVAATAGRPTVSWLLLQVDQLTGSARSQFSAVWVLALAAAALTHALHIEAVLGAFLVGVLARQAPRLRADTSRAFVLTSDGLLAPIFFASAGLRVDIRGLADPEMLGWCALLLVLATAGKLVGAWLGAWAAGLGVWERLALGAGLNPRGAMGIVVAAVGLGLGVLNTDVYSMIVVVAIVTTLVAPWMLRATLGRVKMSAEEAERLAQERFASTSFVRSLKRALIPTRGGPNVQLAAQLLGHLSGAQPLEITSLFVTREPPRGLADSQSGLRDAPDAASHAIASVRDSLALVAGPTPIGLTLAGREPAEVILREAKRGQDLVVFGASEQGAEGALFNRVIDDVVQNAPCATLIVRSRIAGGSWDTAVPRRAIRRILVPAVGTESSRHAAELASAIAASVGATVTLLHVVVHPAFGARAGDLEQRRALAARIVDAAAEHARNLGGTIETRVVDGSAPEDEVVRIADEGDYDLILLGANVRELTGRAFYGHRVDSILARATRPVAVIS